MRTAKVFLLLLLPFIALGQGEIAKFNTVFKDNYSIGLGLRNTSLKFSYRRGHFVSIYERWYYELEFSQIKDPQEIKFSNPFYLTTSKIYYAKTNAFYELRFGYGRMNILTQKMDRGSVEIRFLLSSGGSLGLIKPVYYTVVDKTATYEYDTKFTENILLQQIVGMAPFYKGLDELKINPGGYVKVGISFEHSKKENAIAALECGVSLSAFLLPVTLIYGQTGKHFFPTLFLQYRIGEYFYTLKHKNDYEQSSSNE